MLELFGFEALFGFAPPIWLSALVNALTLVGVVMTIAGYAVLFERKICGWIQGRRGPNRTAIPYIKAIPVVGPFLTKMGLMQPIADVGKFVLKEEPVPGHVNNFYYNLAPVCAMIPALTTMVVLPVGVMDGKPIVLAPIDIGVLFILAVSSLGVYGIILAGWACNSKYPFLGGIRSSAQMISYELAMGLSLLPVFMWANGPIMEAADGTRQMIIGWSSFDAATIVDAGALSLHKIVLAQSGAGPLSWNIVVMPVAAIIFLVAVFAETNRLPFDMPEAETELVAGYNTEYGAFKFGMFFVAEYAHIIIGSAVFTLLFLGGWTLFPFLEFSGIFGALVSIGIFLAKTLALVFLFIWVRWTLPRFRYDQVMNLGWKIMLPAAIANLVVYILLIAWITPKAA